MSWHQVPLTPGARKVRTRCCWPTPHEREHGVHLTHSVQEQFLWTQSGPSHTPPSEHTNDNTDTFTERILKLNSEHYTETHFLVAGLNKKAWAVLWILVIPFQMDTKRNSNSKPVIYLLCKCKSVVMWGGYRDTAAGYTLDPVGSLQSTAHAHTLSYETSEREKTNHCRFWSTETTMTTERSPCPHLTPDTHQTSDR